MKLKKLWLAIITITFTLMLSAMCSAAVIASGNCGAVDDGSNVKYELAENGGTIIGKPAYTLTLRGSGPMADYASYDQSPWSGYYLQITGLSIGQDITKIGNYAFSSISSLQGNVVIPNTVTSIGDNAFDSCYNIQNIEIPNSVTTIGKYAFYDCDELQSIVIPDSVKVMGEYAFYSCDYTKSAVINGNAIEKMSFADWISLQSVIISDGVTKIGNSAFACDQRLQSVSIPNSVTTIEDYAFEDCESLQSITIPASVTTMGTNIFYNCTALTNITHYVYADGTSAPLPADIPANVKVKEIIVVKDNSLSLEMKVPSSAFGGDDASSKYLEAANLIVNEKEYPLENCYIENNDTFIFPIELKGSSNLGITDVRAEVYAKASPDSTDTLYYATDPLTLKWA